MKPGDIIAEIETDKATMEVEAVDEGPLTSILVPAGTEGVKVNTPIAVIGTGRCGKSPPAACESPRHAALCKGQRQSHTTASTLDGGSRQCASSL